MRLSRPFYESLPYVYMGLGAGALAVSFYWHSGGWSDVLLGFGVLALVGGLVVALRRRDFRIQKRRYGADLDDED